MGKYATIISLKICFLAAIICTLQCGDMDTQESKEETENQEGSHYPGDDCGSCHGNQARAFTVAGTMYTDSPGTTVAAGSIVKIMDINGAELFRLTTDNSGNFYTNRILVYPAKAESITGNKTMTQSFSAAGSSCNNASCHNSSLRIY